MPSSCRPLPHSCAGSRPSPSFRSHPLRILCTARYSPLPLGSGHVHAPSPALLVTSACCTRPHFSTPPRLGAPGPYRGLRPKCRWVDVARVWPARQRWPRLRNTGPCPLQRKKGWLLQGPCAHSESASGLHTAAAGLHVAAAPGTCPAPPDAWPAGRNSGATRRPLLHGCAQIAERGGLGIGSWYGESAQAPDHHLQGGAWRPG